MTVKYGEMTNLVNPVISVDQYKPKIGEANETVVLAFEVAFEQPAKDLSNLIETGVINTLDVDISEGPNKNGSYVVFVEFERNKDLYNDIMEVVKVASQVTAITEWRFNYFKGEDTLDLTEQNLAETVVDNQETYVLQYGNMQNTNEDIERVKKLAGL
jgi:hypothetical protein